MAGQHEHGRGVFRGDRLHTRWASVLTDRLSFGLAVLGATLVFIQMALIVVDVAGRSTRLGSVAGVVEYVEVLFVGVVYLGLAQAQREGAHIRVRSVVMLLEGRARSIIRAGALVVALLVVGWLTLETGLRAIESLQRREYRFGLAAVPIWPARLLVPTGLAAWLLAIAADLLSGDGGGERPAHEEGI